MSKISRYRSVLIWLVKDIASKFKYQLSLIAVSSVIGSAGYVSAFGVGYLYIKSVQSGKVPDHPLLTRFFDTPAELLLALVPSIGLLVISAALIEYWGSREANKVAGRYADYCVQRIVRLVSGGSSHHQLGYYGSKAKVEMLSLIMKESRLCGIAARLLSRGLVNLAGLPVVFFVLVWLSPELTLLTIIFGLLGIVGYYWLSLRGANYRKLLEHLGKDARIERLNLVSRALYGAADIKDKDSQINAAFERGASHAFGEAFAGQRNTLEASNLLSKILIAIILMLVFVLANNQVLSGELNWGQLLVYVGALQLFAVRLIGAARVIVSVNRFYPSISRYWKFVEAFDRPSAKTKQVLNEKLGDIILTFEDGVSQTLLKARYGILMALPVGRDDLAFMESLHYENQPHSKLSLRLVNPLQAEINASLDDYFGFHNLPAAELVEGLKAWGIEHKRAVYLTRNKDKTLKQTLLAKLSAHETLVLSLIAVQHGTVVDLVIINYEMLVDIEVIQRNLILDRLDDLQCPVMIAFASPDEHVANWVTHAFTIKNRMFKGIFSIHEIIEKGWKADKKQAASLMDMAMENADEEY